MKVDIGPYISIRDQLDLSRDSDRKIEVKIDPYDIWDLDYTLALIIHPALIAIKEDKTGYPGNLSSREEWEEIIDKMIWSFDKIVNGDVYRTPYDRIQEGLDLFAKYYMSLWT